MAQTRQERRSLERKDFGQKATGNMANKNAAVRPGMMRWTAVGPYSSAAHA
jgi:hypothetical protein